MRQMSMISPSGHTLARNSDTDVSDSIETRDEAVRTLDARLLQIGFGSDEGRSGALKASLCALLLGLDPTISITKIVEALPPAQSDVSLSDILNIMANLNYKAVNGDVATADLDPRLLPCLYFPLRNGKPVVDDVVVVQEIEKRQDGVFFKVFNGGRTETLDQSGLENCVGSDGRAYFFIPINKDDELLSKEMRTQTGMRWFAACLRRFDKLFLQLAALGFVLSLVGLGTPLFIMLTYDRVIAPRNIDPLYFLVVGVCLSTGMEWLLRSLRAHLLSWLAARFDYVTGTTIFERLVNMSPAVVERASVSAQIARIKTIESVRDFFGGPVFMSVIDFPSIFVSILAIAWFSGELALVPIVVSVLYIALFVLVRRKVMVVIRQAAKTTSATQQFTIETFQKHEAIRSSGLSDVWYDLYRNLSGRENIEHLRLYMWGMVGETAAHGLTLVAGATTLVYGVHLIWADQISAGVLVASMILTWRVLMPLHSICTMIPRFEQMRNTIEQIDNLMDVPTEVESDEDAARPAKIVGQISFTNAGMRYTKQGGPIFLGLNATIQAGKAVVVSGASGSGKSSVLKLALGLYQPVTGAVAIDGYDIRQLAQRDFRKMIGYIPQSPNFLSGSIADNLRFARPMATDAELWAALEQVKAAEDVRKLPDGLATQVGNGTEEVVGSVLQYRLAYARVLLQGAPILLIDEQPNSILNAGIADLLKDLLRASQGKRTIIFVSHRVDMMRMAHRVIRLRRGKAPVFSTLDQVLENAA